MAKIAWSQGGWEIAVLIQRARELQRDYGLELVSHHTMNPLLERYRQAIERTAQLTISLGIPSYCIACAGQDGVCCFRGVEQRYDEYLLLLNLLLGNQGLWPESETASTCYFCSSQGCLLTAKHSFCLNFFCAGIKEALGPQYMAIVNRQVGQELIYQWELERVMLPWLWRIQGKSGLS